MASPYYDKTAECWKIKVKSDAGKWVAKRLSPRCSPPSSPGDIPPEVRSLAAAYHAVQPGPSGPFLPMVNGYKPIDLYARLAQFETSQGQVLRPSSIKILKSAAEAFRRHCKANGISYLHEVRPATIRDFCNQQIAARGLSQRTMKIHVSMLGRLFSDAIEYEEIPGPNPIRVVAKRLKAVDDNNSPPKVLTPEEIAAFMGEIKRRKERPYDKGPSSRLPQWVEDIVVVMLNTGMRVSAALSMRFDWVENHKINVPAPNSKSRKAYSALLNEKVRSIIERRRQELGPDQPRVFPEIDHRQWLYARLKYIARACIRRGEWKQDKGSYNHILRHTFITESLNRGVPLVHVSKIVGHTTVACTQRYDHSTFDQAVESALSAGVTL